jgi:glycosyltransferase involved in cell wall biosynthesis
MAWDSYDHETYESEVINRIEVHQVNAKRFESISHPYWSSHFADKLVLKIETLLFEDRFDWAISARKKAMDLIKKNKIDIIFTTGPPPSVHFLGYYLKKKTRLPWVMDFRDPFVTPTPVYEIKSTRNYLFWLLRYRILFKMYESLWAKMTDAVISVTPSMTGLMKQNLPQLKIYTITNGYDEEDFNHFATPQKINPNQFTITFTGRFHPSKTHKNFFLGLNAAISLYPEIKNKLKIIFIGYIESEFLRYIKKSKAKTAIQCLGAKSHYEALQYQQKSDINLIFQPVENDYTIPGKFFEYLRSGKPILTISHKCQLRTIVEKNRLGIAVHPENHEGIANAIYKLFKEWENHSLASYKPSKKLLKKYERKELTKSLSEVFNQCLAM